MWQNWKKTSREGIDLKKCIPSSKTCNFAETHHYITVDAGLSVSGLVFFKLWLRIDSQLVTSPQVMSLVSRQIVCVSRSI